ncbi:MAG: hypothetical protein IJF83_04090 [Methanobrevibacter sp.]|nr:hypothetical protein [Methanobrevibacter sp.]
MLIVIGIAVTFLGVASAAEEIINGETFFIPDGFVENETLYKETIDSDGIKTIQKGFNNGTAGIIISVGDYGNARPKLPTTMPDFTNKTINGIDGIFSEDRNTFIYVNGTHDININVYNVALEDILIGN